MGGWSKPVLTALKLQGKHHCILPVHMLITLTHLQVILCLAEMYPEALRMKAGEMGHTPLENAVDTKASKNVIAALAEKFPELLESTHNGCISPLCLLCKWFRIYIQNEDWFMSILQMFVCSKEVILVTGR